MTFADIAKLQSGKTLDRKCKTTKQVEYTRVHWDFLLVLKTCSLYITECHSDWTDRWTRYTFSCLFLWSCSTFQLDVIPNTGRKAKKMNITCMHWMLKYKCEDITHQRSNRWPKNCCKQTTTLTGDCTSGPLSTERANAHADILHQRIQCVAQLACLCDSGLQERMDNMREYRRLHGYQPQSSVSLLAVQCVPAGSCSGPCCGSEWSSLRPRWCRTVHTAYSRSRSAAR